MEEYKNDEIIKKYLIEIKEEKITYKDILCIEDSQLKLIIFSKYCEFLEEQIDHYKSLYEFESNKLIDLNNNYNELLDSIKNIPYVKRLRQDLNDRKSNIWNNDSGIQGGK